jgi:hypothetical protein
MLAREEDVMKIVLAFGMAVLAAHDGQTAREVRCPDVHE